MRLCSLMTPLLACIPLWLGGLPAAANFLPAPELTAALTQKAQETGLPELHAKVLERLAEHVTKVQKGEVAVDVPVARGTTLLMAAVMDTCHGVPPLPGGKPIPVEAVQWLLEHGADPHMRNRDGHTALDLATDERKRELLRAAMEKQEQKN